MKTLQVNLELFKKGKTIDSGKVKILSKRDKRLYKQAKAAWISPHFPAN